MAPDGEAPYTDGRVVFVSADAPVEQQRREVLVQAALLGAGSFDRSFLRPLRGRPSVARRYLTLEADRVVRSLSLSMPLVRTWPASGVTTPSTAPGDSIRRADSREPIPDGPPWFGRIALGALLAGDTGRGSAPVPLKFQVRLSELPDSNDDEEHESSGRIMKLFSNPLARDNALTNLFAKMMRFSRQPGDDAPSGDMGTGGARSAENRGVHARPVPVPIQFAGDRPGSLGSGAIYAEWDDDAGRYRPEWCRVVEIPFDRLNTTAPERTDRDDTLRRRLARINRRSAVARRRPDGDDLDPDAVIDVAIDIKGGRTPDENVYLARNKPWRDLGILVLLDASGSVTESNPGGRSVHDQQRRAAATLVEILEKLGDRVALYAFRSRGRDAVQLLPLKPFDHRFGAGPRSRLAALKPAGYTRLGAAVRHAGEILKRDSGTASRLLLVLSDGYPYDDGGYEGRYAEADTRRALAELRDDGTACLCLSIGTSTGTEALNRVFGSAAHASAPELSTLSPRMDELFLSTLKELSRARTQPAA